MDNYIIVGWPEIQEYFDYEDFDEHATLITPNDFMGIGSSTYLIEKEWVKSVENQEYEPQLE